MNRQSNVSRLNEAIGRAEIEQRDQTAILDNGLRLHVLALANGIAIWRCNSRVSLDAARASAEACDELARLHAAASL